MIKGMSKADAFAKAGLEYTDCQHGNQAALSLLAAKSLGHRVSTTAAAVSATGGPAKASPAPAGKRVDRQDAKTSRSTAQALHDAALQAMKAGRS